MGTVDWFDWELGVPIVSISQHGVAFNRAAVALLGMAPFVIIGVDRDKRTMIVKPMQSASGEHASHCIAFAEHERQGNVRLLSKDLVRFLASRVRKPVVRSMRFVAVWDDAEGAMVVDLERPISQESPRETVRS